MTSNVGSKFRTHSAIELKSFYTATDLSADVEPPAEYPYTRGIHPEMYRRRLWTMRQYSGFASAKETNERFRYLLSKGTTGLSAAFDLPTQMGFDADDQKSRGEVGRVGVSISTLADMRVLLDGIDLSKISLSMTINATAPVLLAMLVVLAQERGVALESLSGTVQNDLLKEYISRGTYIYPIKSALRLSTDLIEYSSKNLPKWNPISISGYHMREAGANAIQELAFTFLNAITYCEILLARGLEFDHFAPRLAFFFNCHSDFFEEIAKFRVARRIWAKISRDRFSSKLDRSQQLRFHTQTAGSSLTAVEAENNIIRTSLQALSAVLGGTQSLHTNGFDEAISLPSQASAQLALRTQQVIAYEIGVTSVVDPLAGSYFIESLSDRIEFEVNKLIDEVLEDGGMIAAIERGKIQTAIENSAYQFQKEVENKTRLIVGLNTQSDQEAQPSNNKLARAKGLDSAKVEKRQIKATKEYKRLRDLKLVDNAIRDLKEAASSDQNLMPAIVSALKSNLTLGEISKVFKDIFGSYT